MSECVCFEECNDFMLTIFMSSLVSCCRARYLVKFIGVLAADLIFVQAWQKELSVEVLYILISLQRKSIKRDLPGCLTLYA